MAENEKMPDSPLQHVVDGVRSRLQAELDAQLGTLVQNHDVAIERARVDAERAAEERWSARVEATRAEWSARLASEVEAAQAEAERRLVAEAMRVRIESEQAAAEAAVVARETLAHSLDQERERAQQALDTERAAFESRIEAEREQARRQLDHEREQAERALAEARRAFEAERPRTEALLGADAGRLLEAIAAIDSAGSLSDILALTAAAAVIEAPRAALFVVNGPQLEEWRVSGIPALSGGVVRMQSPDAGVLGHAAMTATVAETTPDGLAAPGFAALEPNRAALAVPLTLGAQVVGAIYADEGSDGEVAPSWREAVQILGRHSSARLAYLTAMRTMEAVRLTRVGGAPGPRTGGDGEQGARRYARLLVSEIKLYNEAAVRVGREKRDLLRRLKPEIDRAKRLYDERIPVSTTGRDACFQQELVQTLADGDASLLG